MQPRPRLQAVIFDLDGTLVTCPYDFVAMRQAMLEVAERFGLSLEKIRDLGILEAIKEGERLLGRETGKDFKTQADEAVLAFELQGLDLCFPLEGAKLVLSWLEEKGLRVGIITRNSIKVVEKILQQADFHYDALLAREAVPEVKPHPAHLQAMLARLQVTAADAIMVGDHIWDITGGKAAGLPCVGVTTGSSSKDDLYQAGADVVLEDVRGLPNWLKEHYAMVGDEA
jgi:phosphoglycolate phosphatase